MSRWHETQSFDPWTDSPKTVSLQLERVALITAGRIPPPTSHAPAITKVEPDRPLGRQPQPIVRDLLPEVVVTIAERELRPKRAEIVESPYRAVKLLDPVLLEPHRHILRHIAPGVVDIDLHEVEENTHSRLCPHIKRVVEQPKTVTDIDIRKEPLAVASGILEPVAKLH